MRGAIIVIWRELSRFQTRGVMARVTTMLQRPLNHRLRCQIWRTRETRHALDVCDVTVLGVVERDPPVPGSRSAGGGVLRAAHSQNPIRISIVASAFSTVSWIAKCTIGRLRSWANATSLNPTGSSEPSGSRKVAPMTAHDAQPGSELRYTSAHSAEAGD